MTRTLLFLALLPTAASAQDGIDAHDFYLTPQRGDAYSSFSVRTPAGFDTGDWFVAAVLEYAHTLLELEQTHEDGSMESQVALGRTGVLNLAAGVAIHRRFLLDVSLPISPFSTGLDGKNGFLIGDLRAAATIPFVLPREDRGVGLSLSPWVDVPTGNPSAFFGSNSIGIGGELSFAARSGPLTFGLSGGATYRTKEVEVRNLSGGSTAHGGASLGLAASEHWGATLDFRLAHALTGSNIGTPGELRLTSRHQVSRGFTMFYGGALGVMPGIGTSDWRAFLGAAYGPTQEERDLDGDGLPDRIDGCPEEPETHNGYKDDDGCPDTLSSLQVTISRDGHPVDDAVALATLDGGTRPAAIGHGQTTEAWYRPGDSVELDVRFGNCFVGSSSVTLDEGANTLDIPLTRREGTARFQILLPSGLTAPDTTIHWLDADVDECTPGLETPLPDDGVLPVGIGTHRVRIMSPDRAPIDALVEIHDGRETLVGPFVLGALRVRTEGERVLLSKEIHFSVASARLWPEAHARLDELAAFLSTHPEISHVEIAGHADPDGADAANQDLSERRARAIERYLVEQRGIDASRLSIRGYGETQLVNAALTEDEKAQNRRATFHIAK